MQYIHSASLLFLCVILDLACALPKYSKCRENPCKSGLQCVDRQTGYECVCPKGKNCHKECHGDKCHEGNFYAVWNLEWNLSKLTTKGC